MSVSARSYVIVFKAEADLFGFEKDYFFFPNSFFDPIISRLSLFAFFEINYLPAVEMSFHLLIVVGVAGRQQSDQFTFKKSV